MFFQPILQCSSKMLTPVAVLTTTPFFSPQSPVYKEVYFLEAQPTPDFLIRYSFFATHTAAGVTKKKQPTSNRISGVLNSLRHGGRGVAGISVPSFEAGLGVEATCCACKTFFLSQG